MLVERTSTPLTTVEFARIFLQAFRSEFKRSPSANEANWLFALLRHENRNGRAITNYNWGNLIATAKYPHYKALWWSLDVPNLPDRTPKERDFKTRMIEHRSASFGAPAIFRARASHAEGAAAWFRLLKSETHRRIIEAARANDSTAFHRAISTPHPVTGKAYCPHCKGASVGRAYRALKKQTVNEGIFSDLKHDSIVSKKKSQYSGFSFWAADSFTFSREEKTTLEEGATGLLVVLIQIRLNFHKIGLKNDGVFGPITKRSVQDFQASVDLTNDGIIGEKTWKRLL